MPFAASGAQPLWMGNANQQPSTTFLTLQDFTFDNSGNLFAAAGIGMWKIASASVVAGATWQANSVGIENLVANHVDAPAGNWPVAGVWDRGFWALANPDVFPSDYWPDTTYSTSYDAINGGWAFDWASANTNFLAGWAGSSNVVPATTASGGHSWVIWASISSGTVNIGGDIAASTTSNWIVVPANSSGNLLYTTNGGTTFSAATISATTPFTAGTQHGFHLAADRDTANTFCLVDNSENIYASVNSGATWSEVNSGTLSGVK